jgi:hypothetical protein
MLVLHIPSDMTLVHHASGLWISLPMLIFIIGGIATLSLLGFLVSVWLRQSGKSELFSDQSTSDPLAALKSLLPNRSTHCEGLIMHAE